MNYQEYQLIIYGIIAIVISIIVIIFLKYDKGPGRLSVKIKEWFHIKIEKIGEKQEISIKTGEKGLVKENKFQLERSSKVDIAGERETEISGNEFNSTETKDSRGYGCRIRAQQFDFNGHIEMSGTNIQANKMKINSDDESKISSNLIEKSK